MSKILTAFPSRRSEAWGFSPCTLERITHFSSHRYVLVYACVYVRILVDTCRYVWVCILIGSLCLFPRTQIPYAAKDADIRSLIEETVAQKLQREGGGQAGVLDNSGKSHVLDVHRSEDHTRAAVVVTSEALASVRVPMCVCRVVPCGAVWDIYMVADFSPTGNRETFEWVNSPARLRRCCR